MACIRRERNRCELVFLHAVVDHPRLSVWFSNLFRIGFLFVIADEAKRVSEVLKQALHIKKHATAQGVAAVVQAAPVGRIEAGYAIPVHPQG
ncbi:hypothetical protein D3C80_1491000 [compost metagenome]